MNVKQLRLKLGITQSEFAKKIGVSQRLVSAWENGVVEVSSKNRSKIFVAFGVFIGNDDDMYYIDEARMCAKAVTMQTKEPQLIEMRKSIIDAFSDCYALTENILKICSNVEGMKEMSFVYKMIEESITDETLSRTKRYAYAFCVSLFKD